MWNALHMFDFASFGLNRCCHMFPIAPRTRLTPVNNGDTCDSDEPQEQSLCRADQRSNSETYSFWGYLVHYGSSGPARPLDGLARLRCRQPPARFDALMNGILDSLVYSYLL